MADAPLSHNNAGRPTSRKRTIITVVKWTLFALVAMFVVHRGYTLWESEKETLTEANLKWPWLLLASLLYLLGWLPSVCFFGEMLRRIGNRASWLEIARAYYCGHLGKYVPGKAAVLVIRAGMVTRQGKGVGTAALIATYETLAVMGAGLAIAIALSPTLLSNELRSRLPNWLQTLTSHWYAPALIVGLATLLLLPVVSKLLTLATRKMTPAEFQTVENPISIDSRFLAIRLTGFVFGWAIHGLSLGCVICGVTDCPFNLADWPVWTGAVSLATTVGFLLIFAPGGLGIREGILLETLLLQPDMTSHSAVLATVFLRVVWFLAEIAGASMLYYLFPGNDTPTADAKTDQASNVP